jgi:hypothetical protein
VQQGKNMMVTETARFPQPSEWEATWYAITLEQLVDDSPLTLSDTIIPQNTGDETFTFQWDFTLGAGQTYVINLTNSIRPVTVGLNIALTNGNVVISWPTIGMTTFQLEATTSLAAPVAWIAITNQPALVGEQYQVTMPTSEAAMFYRLQF